MTEKPERVLHGRMRYDSRSLPEVSRTVSRAGNPHRFLATLGFVVLLVVTGCSETVPAATTTATPAPVGAGPVDLPYNPDPPKDAKIIATLLGDQNLDGGCVWLRQGTIDVNVLWPPGFAAEFNPARIIDADGAVVAQEGDRIELTGSFAADATVYQPHRCVIGTELWLAGRVTKSG